MLGKDEGGFEFPIPIRLGMTGNEARNLLGEPTLKYRSTVMFDHAHQETIRNEPFTVSNTVALAVRDGTSPLHSSRCRGSF